MNAERKGNSSTLLFNDDYGSFMKCWTILQAVVVWSDVQETRIQRVIRVASNERFCTLRRRVTRAPMA